VPRFSYPEEITFYFFPFSFRFPFFFLIAFNDNSDPTQNPPPPTTTTKFSAHSPSWPSPGPAIVDPSVDKLRQVMSVFMMFISLFLLSFMSLLRSYLLLPPIARRAALIFQPLLVDFWPSHFPLLPSDPVLSYPKISFFPSPSHRSSSSFFHLSCHPMTPPFPLTFFLRSTSSNSLSSFLFCIFSFFRFC